MANSSINGSYILATTIMSVSVVSTSSQHFSIAVTLDWHKIIHAQSFSKLKYKKKHELFHNNWYTSLIIGV